MQPSPTLASEIDYNNVKSVYRETHWLVLAFEDGTEISINRDAIRWYHVPPKEGTA